MSGPRRAGSDEIVRPSYHDPAPGSGVEKLTIRWGDGKTTQVQPGTHRIAHAYRRAGRYAITVTAVDRAGNKQTVVRHREDRSRRGAPASDPAVGDARVCCWRSASAASRVPRDRRMPPRRPPRARCTATARPGATCSAAPGCTAPTPSTSGVAQGWWRNVASTTDGRPTTIPNAYNAGDFSQASMNGYVGWYRRDFTLPARRLRQLRAEGEPPLDHPLRVGQLPRHRVAQRPRDRQPRRRVRALGARPERPSRRRQPPDRARRQPADRQPTFHRARAGVVELRRDPARGVPARGSDRRPVAGAGPAAPAVPPVRRATIHEQVLVRNVTGAAEGAAARARTGGHRSISGRPRSRRTHLDGEGGRSGSRTRRSGRPATRAVHARR